MKTGSEGRPLTPAVVNFLLHCYECSGWCSNDPIQVYPSVIAAAERRGLVAVEREGGLPAAALLTREGMLAMRRYK